MRPRKTANLSLQSYRNLYLKPDGVTYYYQRPDSGERITLGTNKAKAIEATVQANERLQPRAELLDLILADVKKQELVGDHIDYMLGYWEKRVADGGMSQTTLSNYRRQVEKFRKAHGDDRVDQISINNMSSFLEQFPPTQKMRFRAVLKIVWKHAIARGLATINVADATLKETVKVQRKRLSLELFTAIREEVPVWVQTAMDLALYLGSRVGDVSSLRWKDNIKVENGTIYLIYVPEKGRNKKKLSPIRARCEGPVLEILSRCRDDVISEYVLHFPVQGGAFRKIIGKPLLSGYLSHQFSDARDLVFKKTPELFITEDENQFGKMRRMKPKEFPTWHEIRSLSGWLEEQIKKDNGESAQKRYGHMGREMTELYFSRRPVEITEITIGSNSYI